VVSGPQGRITIKTLPVCDITAIKISPGLREQVNALGLAMADYYRRALGVILAADDVAFQQCLAEISKHFLQIGA
jgi:F0F1-type ATP synthase beta subunit